MSREFLAIYNYGMGGCWAFITAPSAQAIRDRYPALEVYEGRPDYISATRFEEMKSEGGNTRGDLSDPTFWLLVGTDGAPPSGPAYRPGV
jgi:hypothetical protein